MLLQGTMQTFANGEWGEIRTLLNSECYFIASDSSSRSPQQDWLKTDKFHDFEITY